jgi:hypothetical protein
LLRCLLGECGREESHGAQGYGDFSEHGEIVAGAVERKN